MQKAKRKNALKNPDMLFIEQINTHHNHFDDYFLFKDSAVLKNVHMSK